MGIPSAEKSVTLANNHGESYNKLRVKAIKSLHLEMRLFLVRDLPCTVFNFATFI